MEKGKNMKILYFTATGNNLYVAKRLGGTKYSIPKLLKENQFEFEDEKIGIIFPIYVSNVPKIVEEFLDKAKLNSKYIFAIGTYGAMSGGAVSHLLEIGKRNNIQFSYINTLLMVDNYLPGFDMNKQMVKEPKKNIEENLSLIIKDVEHGRNFIKKSSAMGGVMRFIASKITSDHFEDKFYVESSCNGCKTCEKVCPVNNIKVKEQPTFQNNCQQCLACIQNCPQKAIRLKGEKSSARFRNNNVDLKEIIEANK